MSEEKTAPAPVDLSGLDAQQLAATVPADELASIKASLKAANESEVLEGRFLASCPGQTTIHIKAADRSQAVALVCLYLGCEPSEVVVAKCKRSAGPRRGDRVLRAEPVAGNPSATGFAYGIEPPE